MGQHHARRGDPSWFGSQDLETRDPDPALPPESPAWDALEATQPHYPAPEQFRERALRRMDEVGPVQGGPEWEPPRPQPRPSWSALDFASYMHFRHPPIGPNRCGCGAQECEIRTKLNLVYWGPNGPPL